MKNSEKIIKEAKYKHELVVPNDELHARLVELFTKYPELTLANDGYEKLSKQIQEDFKEQIDEISDILSKTFHGFRQFNNFYPWKDGTGVSIRMQHKWDISFTGVGYFDINYWNEEIHKKLCDE